MVLCHATRTKYVKSIDSFQNEYEMLLDKLQLDLAHHYDY